MITVTITRTEYGDQGTFGILTIDGNDFSCATGELPDRNNAKGLSCIPCGMYNCLWGYSPHLKKDCYHVNDVEGREGILIHSANFMGDMTKQWDAQVQGCIALGIKTALLENSKGNMQKALMSSRPTVQKFERIMNAESFTLKVKNIG